MAGGTGRAIVIGGSLSGLLVARLLSRKGWDVDIYERIERELAGRGAGIVTHKSLWDALDAMGIDWRDNLGVEIATRRMFTLDGRLDLEIPLAQTSTAWDRMYDLLRQAIPDARYHRGKRLDRIEQTADGVTAHFGDGTHVTGDLLVGSDGIRSSVRAQFQPDVVPTYAGYVAWRGLVPEAAMPKALRDDVFMHMAFCLPSGEQMLGYPVAGPGNDLRPGHRRFNLVWYRPADAATSLQRLLTDDRGTTHELTIPPPAVSRASIAAMRADAERVLAPQFRECWRLSEPPFLQPIYDVLSTRLAFGRVALIGDASFVARPHCGAGVTKAADDAMALVTALEGASGVAAALSRYEAIRQPVGGIIVDHARHLGAYLQSQLKTAAEREAAERHFSPAAVLRETATLDFLSAAG